MNKNRSEQLKKQLEIMSPNDDMYQTILDEIMMLEEKGVYSRFSKKAGGKVKAMKNGGLARRKRSIARGCGAIMENKRKKTLYT